MKLKQAMSCMCTNLPSYMDFITCYVEYSVHKGNIRVTDSVRHGNDIGIETRMLAEKACVQHCYISL